MIELRVASYCENCPNFRAITDVRETRLFSSDPLKPNGDVITHTTVTCEWADRCAAMYDHLEKIQKDLKAKEEYKE